MFSTVLKIHSISVTIFFLIYFIKTLLLLSNANEKLEKFKSYTKILEMIVSTLFLLTGIYLITKIPEIKFMLIIKLMVVAGSIPLAIIAYKKSNKILALISFAMIVAAYGLAEMSRTKKVSVEVADGKTIYETSCAICHGSDGKLGMAGASDLSQTSLQATEIVQIILNGKNAMPKVQMSEEQANAVAKYVLENIKK
ncbi:MAG: c-type cytochrome [Bacteroidia bacterium]|nr:c-type cytochrome [Bacteroidia bacterium]